MWMHTAHKCWHQTKKGTLAARAGPAAACATFRRVSIYIGGSWIRQLQELHMKRLLGLLLVMGVVRCGQKENVGNVVRPSPYHRPWRGC